jgi:hypothetical protein
MLAAAESKPQARFPAEWSLRVLLPEPHSQIARIYGLWNSAVAASGRHLPKPVTIGPVQLKPVLADVHVYDVRPDAPRFAFRLVGTRVTEHMGQHLTGRPIEEIATPRLRTVVSEILNTVESRRATLHIKAPQAVALPNGSHRPLESLWMPFSEDGETVSRIIAVSLLGEPAP